MYFIVSQQYYTLKTAPGSIPRAFFCIVTTKKGLYALKPSIFQNLGFFTAPIIYAIVILISPVDVLK